MRVLVACEESQAVCKAFREKGHLAYSCDIEPCSGGHPEWHINMDVSYILGGSCSFFTCDGILHCVKGTWDMIIAFPPCTHLAVSGARYFEAKRNDGRQKNAVDFFYKFINADCEKICVENPVGIISGNYIKKWFGINPLKPTQIIQPYMFGEHARKKTCLWIKGMPELKPTKIVDPGEILEGGYSVGASANYAKDENGKILSWNDPMTAKIRSKTFPGIAKAMAEQWG